ncbi:hypothetical protein [Bremerella sp.]|uniref:hypothetical protein n=1 Tax=Bremerella sp. TaxID=2795602 RepID=UPI00391AC06B
MKPRISEQEAVRIARDFAKEHHILVENPSNIQHYTSEFLSNVLESKFDEGEYLISFRVSNVQVISVIVKDQMGSVSFMGSRG